MCLTIAEVRAQCFAAWQENDGDAKLAPETQSVKISTAKSYYSLLVGVDGTEVFKQHDSAEPIATAQSTVEKAE